MTQTPTRPSGESGRQENGNRSKSWMIIAIILLIIIAGLLIFFLPKLNSFKKLAEEKEAQRTVLKYDLEKMMVKHDSIKAAYGNLADSLKVKDSIIQANADEIKQLLNYK